MAIKKFVFGNAKGNKYRNVITIVDGIKFHSKKEAKRYSELKIMERFGYIKDIKLQMKHELFVHDMKICSYFADFVYLDIKTNQWIVEDSKGVRTPEYKLKKKLMKAIYNIDILET